MLCLRTRGSKWLNVYGFLLMALCFGVMAVTYQLAPERNTLLFVELMALNTALFFGPNVATFVLPAVVFPPQIRATFHGLSAGSGKVGAVVGTFLYEPVHEWLGVAAVMWLQAAISLAVRNLFWPSICICTSLTESLSWQGAWLSHTCIEDSAPSAAGARSDRAPAAEGVHLVTAQPGRK